MLTSRRNRHTTDAWPGFVDALASVLLVFIFMLMIFVLGQYFLTDVLLGRDRALDQLRQEIAQLAERLSMSESTRSAQQQQIITLQGRLEVTLTERETLTRRLADSEALRRAAEQRVATSEQALELTLLELASLLQDIAALQTLRQQLEREVAALVSSGEQRQSELGALRDRSQVLEARLAASEERTLLAQRTVEQRQIRIADLSAQIEETAQALREEQQLSARRRDEVRELQRQMIALQEQLSAIAHALELAQETVGVQQVELEQLTQRLNLELARKVEELSRYRSEFFGRLREVLGDHPDIHIEGDRFTFQSELLFDSAAAELGRAGEEQLRKLAATVNELLGAIPQDIEWVLRIDGHTDKRPIRSARFPSNWELSTARAISIVRFLVEQGIPPERLAATGFAEFHPLDEAENAQAYSRNRRIEIKLTGR